jgi:hypothetical protein
VPRTHDLEDLLDLLLPHDGTLGPLRRRVASLSKYAVEYRYPGLRATMRQMQSALTIAERVRPEPWQIAATGSKARQTEPASCQPAIRPGWKGAAGTSKIRKAVGATPPRLIQRGVIGCGHLLLRR